MKVILSIFCWVLAIYAVYFPLTYFGSREDIKEVRISHILVNDIELANKVKHEIKDGKNFSDLAEKYSIDEQTKENGGDLGFIQRGRIDKNISNVVFKVLNENETSDPIITKDGWHLVKAVQVKHYSDKENFQYNPYKYLDL